MAKALDSQNREVAYSNPFSSFFAGGGEGVKGGVTVFPSSACTPVF